MRYIKIGNGQRLKESDDNVMMVFENDKGDKNLEYDPKTVDVAIDLIRNFNGISSYGKISVKKLREALSEFSDDDIIDISGFQKKMYTSGIPIVATMFLLETDDKRVLVAGITEPY